MPGEICVCVPRRSDTSELNVSEDNAPESAWLREAPQMFSLFPLFHPTLQHPFIIRGRYYVSPESLFFSGQIHFFLQLLLRQQGLCTHLRIFVLSSASHSFSFQLWCLELSQYFGWDDLHRREWPLYHPLWTCFSHIWDGSPSWFTQCTIDLYQLSL